MKNFFSPLVIIWIVPLILLGVELVPIPLEVEVDKQKSQLGKELFLDPILSKDKTLSCASCHLLGFNGADTVRFSKGIEGQKGAFNSPTVFNAVYNFRQFWDGRAKNLEEQALNPIVNPIEMGNTIPMVIKELKKSEKYTRLFRKIYDNGITKENLAEVLAEFEKTLITPNAPIDKYLRGDKTALNDHEIEGYRLFKEKGCISCHNGINIGGNLYNKFGIYKDAQSEQLGRYNLTHKEEDKYVFKVPSLRNVALTAPYMHDGRAKTLEEAVNMMTKYQLGRPMKKDELHLLVDFLKTFTGELPDSVKDLHVSGQ